MKVHTLNIDSSERNTSVYAYANSYVVTLDNPIYDFDYLGNTLAIDHNGYTNGNNYYLANYTAGIRVLDLSQIGDKSLTEIGFFDSYPSDNETKFAGAWNVYPYFESGVIAINDIESGLILVKASEN